MFVKNISLKRLVGLKCKCVLICIILFIILVNVIMLNCIYNTRFGKRIKEGVDILDSTNIFNMTSYYATLDMTVVSNKNTNTYRINEWYKEGVGEKLNYFDSVNGNITEEFKDGKYFVKNDKNKLILNGDIKEEKTRMSMLSSFLYWYKYIQNNMSECSSKCISNKKKGDIVYTIIIGENNEKSDAKLVNICNNLDIVKLEIITDKNNVIPKTYILYDKNEKEIISIAYIKLEINKKIDIE